MRPKGRRAARSVLPRSLAARLARRSAMLAPQRASEVPRISLVPWAAEFSAKPARRRPKRTGRANHALQARLLAVAPRSANPALWASSPTRLVCRSARRARAARMLARRAPASASSARLGNSRTVLAAPSAPYAKWALPLAQAPPSARSARVAPSTPSAAGRVAGAPTAVPHGSWARARAELA